MTDIQTYTNVPKIDGRQKYFVLEVNFSVSMYTYIYIHDIYIQVLQDPKFNGHVLLIQFDTNMEKCFSCATNI